MISNEEMEMYMIFCGYRSEQYNGSIDFKQGGRTIYKVGETYWECGDHPIPWLPLRKAFEK
jgi:hypothetical protein